MPDQPVPTPKWKLSDPAYQAMQQPIEMTKAQTILLQPRQSPPPGAHNLANPQTSPDKSITDHQAESPSNIPETVNPLLSLPSPIPRKLSTPLWDTTHIDERNN